MKDENVQDLSDAAAALDHLQIKYLLIYKT